jgi:hypothetical protein
MRVRLIRYSFPDMPDWDIVNRDVPLGTVYEVLGYDRNSVTIYDTLTGRSRQVECYFVERDGASGYMPCVCLEPCNEQLELPL